MPGQPTKFILKYDSNIKQYYLSCGFFLQRTFSIEELEDMIKYLKEQNKELKNKKWQ